MKKSELKQLIREQVFSALKEGALTNSYTFRVSGDITIGNGAANSSEAEDMVYEKMGDLLSNLDIKYIHHRLDEGEITHGHSSSELASDCLSLLAHPTWNRFLSSIDDPHVTDQYYAFYNLLKKYE